IVALSGINLLGAFLNLKHWSQQELGWMVGLHLTFVITGVLFALSEKIGHKTGH
ncbi:MAG: TIGR00645 family protein, partial [Betaproteobacteria bacterium]|nr:TIGR00645 family protein [Betaproteobacteria bacterium]